MTTALRSKQTVVCSRCGTSLDLQIRRPGVRYRDVARALGWRFQRRRKKRWMCSSCWKEKK